MQQGRRLSRYFQSSFSWKELWFNLYLSYWLDFYQPDSCLCQSSSFAPRFSCSAVGSVYSLGQHPWIGVGGSSTGLTSPGCRVLLLKSQPHLPQLLCTSIHDGPWSAFCFLWQQVLSSLGSDTKISMCQPLFLFLDILTANPTQLSGNCWAFNINFILKRVILCVGKV